MGCQHSAIIPLGKPVATNHNEKQAFFIVDSKQRKKKNRRKRRKQRNAFNPDDIPLQPISASTVGGIAFEIWVDSQTKMATGTCPAHLARKLEMDEAANGIAGAKIDEKLQKAQERRDEKIRAMREKFELKRKLAEAKIKKLQQEKEQRLERLKDAILQK